MNYFYTCLFLAICFATSYSQRIVPVDEVFPSPDRSMSVRLSELDGRYYYVITDVKNGKTFTLGDEYSTAFAVAWSLDSKSIFAAEHVARRVLV